MFTFLITLKVLRGVKVFRQNVLRYKKTQIKTFDRVIISTSNLKHILLKADFHWEYFCSRMKKQKKKTRGKKKKLSNVQLYVKRDFLTQAFFMMTSSKYLTRQKRKK